MTTVTKPRRRKRRRRNNATIVCSSSSRATEPNGLWIGSSATSSPFLRFFAKGKKGEELRRRAIVDFLLFCCFYPYAAPITSSQAEIIYNMLHFYFFASFPLLMRTTKASLPKKIAPRKKWDEDGPNKKTFSPLPMHLNGWREEGGENRGSQQKKLIWQKERGGR